MPMLFSLGQHAALVAISERLEDGERLLAFLDDLYVVSTPERTVAVQPCCCLTQGEFCVTFPFVPC